MAATRRACIALLRGHLDEAEERIDHAAVLGERIREPDTGNVRMSQRLELIRARGEPDQLRRFAVEAVDHWTGAPVPAHSVAAGFCARAGALDNARRHVAAVLDLGTWRADRSYLWSMFVRELAYAAIALDDRELCQQIFEDLLPLGSSCGVNGAVAPTASMHRRGSVWQVAFAGRLATVPHVKGLSDIARLVATPGAEVHVLDLVDSPDRSSRPGTVVDRSALQAYRRRLADLQSEVDEAAATNDHERRARAEAERQALVEELERVTGVGRQPRQFANHPAERARKAVAGRIRDAIRKLDPVLPELATHLDQTIRTGTYCSYRLGTTVWEVDAG